MNQSDFLHQMQEQLKTLQKQVESCCAKADSNKLSMVVFSGSLDRIIASFIIATGAAAMNTEVTMFFTFWATSSLKDPQKRVSGKNLISRMFGFMLPKESSKLKLPQINFCGMKNAMMKSLMKKKKIASLPELIKLAEECEVKIYICEMSMDLMGMKREEIITYKHLSYCGVSTFLGMAGQSKTTLFI